MKHQTLEQLQIVAEIHQAYLRQPMSRSERLERWAELLERNPDRRLSTLFADFRVAAVFLILNGVILALGEVLRRYPKVLVPELNLGQLAKLVRADFLVDARSVTKVQAQPFKAAEIEQAILEFLDD